MSPGALSRREPARHSAPLPRRFYLRDTATVARELLGALLVYDTPEGRRSGTIVETEAYLGAGDSACHSFGWRRTPRTATMYLAGGHAYVYFTYGMHNMLNVVTREAGEPHAVLLRGIEPVEGIAGMLRRRGLVPLADGTPPRQLTSGPGRLCQALGIDRSLDGADLLSSALRIEPAPATAPRQIETGIRVGVQSSGEAAEWPLRFWLAGNRFVSPARPRPAVASAAALRRPPRSRR